VYQWCFCCCQELSLFTRRIEKRSAYLLHFLICNLCTLNCHPRHPRLVKPEVISHYFIVGLVLRFQQTCVSSCKENWCYSIVFLIHSVTEVVCTRWLLFYCFNFTTILLDTRQTSPPINLARCLPRREPAVTSVIAVLCLILNALKHKGWQWWNICCVIH
jgi:hypothetical protein